MDLTSLLVLAADQNPAAHVVNHPFWVSDSGWWIWSAQQTQLVISFVIMIVFGPMIATSIATGPDHEGHDRFITRNVVAHMVEVIALYLREQVVRPLLHERTEKFMPFLWTLFFFILVNNILGLLPLMDLWGLLNPAQVHEEHRSWIGGTATQNIAVTGVLATFSFIVINIAGIRELGIKGYLEHLTAGAPWFVWPIMIPIEILGTFIKPIALAIRLFANMTAGHILLATLFMFVGMSLKAGLAVGVPVTFASAVGAAAIYCLETFVALLQAFVFMFLTAVFISQLSHHGDHDHDHEHHGVTPENGLEGLVTPGVEH